MKYLIILVTALMVMSCAGEPNLAPDRPGSSGDNPAETYDSALAAELGNPEPRVVTGAVTILYNFGGIIMGRDKAGAMYMIDVSDGTRIDFNPIAYTLSINGISQSVTSVKIAKETTEARWYVIETTGGRVIYVTKP